VKTEEDTFNKLKRIPFEEMEDIYVRDNYAHLHKNIEYTNKLFKKYGWTRDEFMGKWEDTIDLNDKND